MNSEKEQTPPAEQGIDVVVESKPRRKSHRGAIAGAVVTVVAVVALGAGVFTAYASSDSYCMEMCHTPLGGYVETYNQDADVPGVDKWGNEVTNTSAMLATTHRDWNSASCATCHPQDTNRRLTEALWWVTGDYYDPLSEWKSADMAEYYGVTEDEMCLNEACHNLTREELRAKTNDTRLNPHSNRHGDIACSTCHKAHRASVLQCAGCHDEAEVPEGWITPDEEEQLTTWEDIALEKAGVQPADDAEEVTSDEPNEATE